MPAHDWARVSAGVFHHFHTSWIAELAKAFNQGSLPEGYYALAEQITGDVSPDVIALTRAAARPADEQGGPPPGATAVAEAPPQVSMVATADETEAYARKARTLVIRHASGDRGVVALVEIVSPGSKDRERSLRRLVDKACAALLSGIHLLVIDLQPPGPQDPEGVHGAIWAELSAAPYRLPPGRLLTLASYEAAAAPRAYVEPVAVGGPLPDMPLFLEEGWYVPAPLEATYAAAYDAVPSRWREALEG